MKSALAWSVIASAILCGCASNQKEEIHHKKRNNTYDVSQYVEEIIIGDPIISGENRISTAGNYLIISDFKSTEKLLHLFDKRELKHSVSIADHGIGPTEISRLGNVCYDSDDNSLLVLDHGQLRLLAFDMDSIQNSLSYAPTVKSQLDRNSFPNKFVKVGNVYMGTMIYPNGDYGFNQGVGKWDITSGKIEEMKYKHPKVEKSRISLTVSNKHRLYAISQHLYDLISVYDLDGNLKCNIYGPQWEEKIRKGDHQIHYWGDIKFCKEKIIASFSGEHYHGDKYDPTSLVIFDLEGNYERTLKVGYNIVDFCYDEETNRIFMSFNDEIQFGYLNMNEWL